MIPTQVGRFEYGSGSYSSAAYIYVDVMDDQAFNVFMNALLGWNLDDTCAVGVNGANFYWKHFKNFNNLDDMRLFVASLPQSFYPERYGTS